MKNKSFWVILTSIVVNNMGHIIFDLLMAGRASSPALLGAIKSAMSLGEMLGLLIVTRIAKYVSFQVAIYDIRRYDFFEHRENTIKTVD